MDSAPHLSPLLLARGAVRALRRGYARLPISTALRLRIKNTLFGVLDRWVFETALYQSWRHARALERPAGQKAFAADSYPLALQAQAPSEEAWQALMTHRDAVGKTQRGLPPLVDVIIPVYKGYDDTLACIYSALAATVETPHELIVIDDAGPEAALSQKLDVLAAWGLITLLRNERNLGFVTTVNRGMALHSERDVVLLNADAEVYHDWLDRLRRAAYAQPRTASVTPLSNNAEICSYPFTVRNNDMQLEVDYPTLDRFAARDNAGQGIDIPTAVGFCMYIRREALQVVGLFDAERFGKGYGEENDWCLRAAEEGWTHRLAADVFARHAGGGSFGKEKNRRIAAAMKLIAARFPAYHQQVAAFIAADPALPYRRALDVARLGEHAAARSFLFISHTLGGGTEKHLLELRARLEAEGISVFLLRPCAYERHVLVLSHPECPFTPSLRFDMHTERGALVRVLQRLRVERVHVHHLIGFDRSIHDFFPHFMAALGVPYDFTAHDYYAICPRINLINHTGHYCGEPDISVCEGCVRRGGLPTGPVPVWQWRQDYADFLARAEQVFVPDADVASRLGRYFSAVRMVLRPHEESWPERIASVAAPASVAVGDVRRIAVIGAIGQHKGSRILKACAEDAHRRKLKLHFSVIGTVDIADELIGLPTISITGRYEESEITTLLAAQRCHAAWLPSVWPETYCYTLSIAFVHGLMPVVFDLGAQAARVRRAGWGEVLPCAMMEQAGAINDHLLAMALPPPPQDLLTRVATASYASLAEAYYSVGG